MHVRSDDCISSMCRGGREQRCVAFAVASEIDDAEAFDLHEVSHTTCIHGLADEVSVSVFIPLTLLHRCRDGCGGKLDGGCVGWVWSWNDFGRSVRQIIGDLMPTVVDVISFNTDVDQSTTIEVTGLRFYSN